jgi:ribosome-binding factor A
MITITSVDVSPDMTHAKIYFTVLEKDKLQHTLEGLKRSAGFLRAQLAKRVQMYTTPELRFVYDESVERGDRLSRLIDAALKPRK